MKNKFLLLILIFIMFKGYSQQAVETDNISVTLSEIFKDDKKFTDLTFSIDDDNGGIFVGRNFKKGSYIEHYDSNLKLLNSTEFEVDNKFSKILDAFVSNNKLHIIESVYNRDEKELQYYKNSTSVEDFKFQRNKILGIPFEDFKKVAAVVYGIPIGFGGVDDDFFGQLTVSKARNYFVITQDVTDKNNELHQIHVFNSDFEKQYSHFFEREIKDRKFDFQGIEVDDKDGTVFLLGKSITKDKKEKKEGGKYQYELYRIKGEERKVVIFDSEDKFVASLTTIENNGEVFCIGFYSEKNDSRYKGVVHFKIEPNSFEIVSRTYSPFTDQFIMDKYGKDKDKELKNIKVKSVHINRNNEIILTGQEEYITYRQSKDFSYSVFHDNDIISAKLDSNGNLLWARNINKLQSSTNQSPYHSFVSVYLKEKLYFFVNGSDEVKKIKNDRIEFRHAKMTKLNLYVIELDDNGEINYRILIEDDKSDLSFAARNGILINGGEQIIFQGRRKSKKQLAKLQF